MKNYLLIILSLLTRNKTSFFKTVDGETVFQGIQTNEPVAKYVIEQLSGKGERLEKIILMCSNEVVNKKLEMIDGKTTKEYFTDAIINYAVEKFPNLYNQEDEQTLFECVMLNGEEGIEAGVILKPIMQVINIASQKEIQADTCRLYIDFTGGLRTSALSAIFIARKLQNMGVEIEKILYSNISSIRDGTYEKPYYIEECTKTYDLFDLYVDTESGRRTEKTLRFVKKYNANNKELEALFNSEIKYNKSLSQNQSTEVKMAAAELKEKIDKVKIDSPFLDDSLRASVGDVTETKNVWISQIRKLIKDGSYQNELQQVLTFFKTHIMDILMDYQLIDVSKEEECFTNRDKKFDTDKVLSEIITICNYYSRYNKEGGFLGFARCVVSQITKFPELKPSEAAKQYIDINRLYSLQTYMKKTFDMKKRTEKRHVDEYAKRNSEYDKNMIKRFSDNIVKTLENENVDYVINIVNELIQTRQKAACIYFSQGFPFPPEYTGYKNEINIYYDYVDIYNNVLQKGLRIIDRVYEGTSPSDIIKGLPMYNYQSFLNRLLNDSAILKRIFPITFSDRIKTSLPEDEFGCFIAEFIKKYNEINYLRNQIHHSQDKKADFDKAYRMIEDVFLLIEEAYKKIPA